MQVFLRKGTVLYYRRSATHRAALLAPAAYPKRISHYVAILRLLQAER